jgi:drug/metabolite transporter (DMT)-like permease
MHHLVGPVLFGLAASLCWGSGDFNGGLASRRASPATVVLGAYAVGLIFLVVLALLTREPLPDPASALWGAAAGVAGVTGLLAFYSALSTGKMGIAAPVSAVLTASLPVLFSAITTRLPSLPQVSGFALALLAIGLIARPERTVGPPQGFGLALLAGCCFGGFFILISRVEQASVYWPLAIARTSSVLVLATLLCVRQRPLGPGIEVAPLVVLAGILDATGNAFFVLAAHSGRLDVAAILSSLYPAATVLLAAIVLHERVARVQGIGILLVLLAIPLIST